jgi:uncharacterized small protein (DUF1192 family)
MAGSEDAREIVRQALVDLASAKELGPTLEQCIRVAELRQDYWNLWWLRYEALGFDKRATTELDLVMRLRIPAEQYRSYRTKILEDLMERHKMAHIESKTKQLEDRVAAYSVGELDAQIDELDRHIRGSLPPQGLAALDLYDSNKRHEYIQDTLGPTLTEFRKVRSRIRERLHRFLVESEASIVFGQTAATAFERTRRYVDGELASIAPDVLAQFQAAYERSDKGDPEALSQALLSCRRIVKAIADVLYPATGETVKGADGKSREMTDDKYRNRLWQYVGEHASHSSRDLVLATVDELGRRLDLLDYRASRGVHATVDAADADQCILQTYLLMSDLLHLRTPPMPPGPLKM